MNIDGLGKKVVEKFWELKLINKPQDIFSLNYKKIENLDGWGQTSVNNLKISIENSKKVSLQKFIYAIGIRHIGIDNAKLISENVLNINEFIEIVSNNKFNKFLNIDGIKHKVLKNFFSYKLI